MSVVLAIDTATDTGSVAVGTAESLASEIMLGTRRHAAALTPAVAEALRLAGAAFSDVSDILIADGPGSFTGLRIGFATVQGLTRTRDNLKVMTAPSLLGTAWLAAPFADGPVAALYDALRGEVFAGIYDFSAGAKVILHPQLISVDRLVAEHRVVLAVGDGSVLHENRMREWTGRAPVGLPAGAPRAAALLPLLAVPGMLRVVDDVTSWEPDYGRAAEAQVRWERMHGKPLPGPAGHGG